MARCLALVCAGAAALAGGRALVPAAETPASPVLGAMQAELSREIAILGKQPTPPYFLSYEITDTDAAEASAAFGELVHSTRNHHRQLDIDLRAGSYDFDDTHLLRGQNAQSGRERYQLLSMPIDDDPDAIRTALWSYTDGFYKQALEALAKAKTNAQVEVEQEDKSADFSRQTPEQFSGKPVALQVDQRAFEARVKKYTAPFARFGNIYEAAADLSASAETRWFASSEGSAIETSEAYYRLTISASTRADDGMVLPRYESFYASTPEGLPDDATVLHAVDRMIQDLQALRAAPVVEPYTGPAILSGRAAGVFFHEVFGHRIEGHRQKNVEESQTFKKKVGEKILPGNFSVFFDPTLRRWDKWDLVGAYQYDDEGVRARRVTVVDQGVFKSFLMSRTPIQGFPKSNGHGRAQPGFAAVARQSNLIVQVEDPLTRAQLKQMLLDEVQKENKPFGLFFDDIQGGFTLTGRNLPNAFNVLPVMVYKVYPDGRQELVRGVDLIGTPLTAFSKIVAGGGEAEIFNGICGAESGGVPVATVSPSLLISQIEVQKKQASQDRLPILPAPLEAKGP